MLVIIYLK